MEIVKRQRQNSGSQELSRTQEISPLTKLLTFLQLDYGRDLAGPENRRWNEVLSSYPFEDVQVATERLKLRPGEYSGLPSLIEVQREISVVQEEKAKQKAADRTKEERQYRDHLKQCREQNPEEYVFRFQDLLSEAMKSSRKRIALGRNAPLAMPAIPREPLSDIELADRKEMLKQQKQLVLKRFSEKEPQ